MNETFQQELRDARRHGAFQGVVYLTCENARCPVSELQLTVREGPPALPFQLPLRCVRCREPLRYYGRRGGMPAQRPKRRRSGSIGSLKSALWATITYNLDVIEDQERDHDLRQKACNCLVQASLAYGKIVELYDLERTVKELEQLASRNGHQPT